MRPAFSLPAAVAIGLGGFALGAVTAGVVLMPSQGSEARPPSEFMPDAKGGADQLPSATATISEAGPIEAVRRALEENCGEPETNAGTMTYRQGETFVAVFADGGVEAYFGDDDAGRIWDWVMWPLANATSERELFYRSSNMDKLVQVVERDRGNSRRLNILSNGVTVVVSQLENGLTQLRAKKL